MCSAQKIFVGRSVIFLDLIFVGVGAAGMFPGDRRRYAHRDGGQLVGALPVVGRCAYCRRSDRRDCCCNCPCLSVIFVGSRLATVVAGIGIVKTTARFYVISHVFGEQVAVVVGVEGVGKISSRRYSRSGIDDLGLAGAVILLFQVVAGFLRRGSELVDLKPVGVLREFGRDITVVQVDDKLFVGENFHLV